MVSPHPSLYFFLQFLFQLYLMSIPAPDEISMEDPLCDSSLGSMVTLDYVTPLTVSWFARAFAPFPPPAPASRPVDEEALADVDRLDLTEEEALVLFGAPSKTWSTKRDQTREQRKDRQLFRSIDDDGGQRFRSRG